MQAAALQVEAVDAGVLQGHPAKAFRQQAGVAVVHHGGLGKHIADFHHGIQGSHFHRTPSLAVAVGGPVVVVQRQHAEGATAAAAAGARVELEAVHGKGIEAKAHRALGEAGFELADQALGPGFGIAVAGGAGLALAVVAVEVEVAQQQVEAAAFDKAFGPFLGGHCRHRAEPQYRSEHGQGQGGIDTHGGRS